jgi:hypothetical protein
MVRHAPSSACEFSAFFRGRAQWRVQVEYLRKMSGAVPKNHRAQGRNNNGGESMKIIQLILMIAALIVFGLAAFEVTGQRVNLVAMGLFFMALAQLLSIV